MEKIAQQRSTIQMVIIRLLNAFTYLSSILRRLFFEDYDSNGDFTTTVINTTIFPVSDNQPI